jgi:glycosyltransferase involved in cell wall biosynthesis
MSATQAIVAPTGACCEVRVPTFRRQRLLERALRSLVAQTFPTWCCIVFDDCPDGSARAVVEAIGDDRITYRRNATNLGAIGNIDQCFRNTPYVRGEYASVLEDDNYFLPEHLQTQLDICTRHGVEVVFAAQACEEVIEPGAPGALGKDKTIAWIYPEGAHDARDMLSSILFSHAFSNGSAFWRLGGASNFEMGKITTHPGVQESARIFGLRGRTYVSHHPTAVWRWNDPRDSYVSARAGADIRSRLHSRWKQLLERREIADLRRFFLATHGVETALAIASQAEDARRAAIENAVLMCGRFIRLTNRGDLWRLRWLLRGFVFRLLVPARLRWPAR